MESAERVVVAVAARQEAVYVCVLESVRRRMEGVEGQMTEVSQEVGGASPSGGYVNREKQLGALQVYTLFLTYPYPHVCWLTYRPSVVCLCLRSLTHMNVVQCLSFQYLIIDAHPKGGKGCSTPFLPCSRSTG